MEPSDSETATTSQASDSSSTSQLGHPPPGYRLPDELRLGSVHLQVADLGRSLDYYQHILGLAVLNVDSHTASLGPAGSKQPIVVLTELPGASPNPRHGRLGLYHFAILLPDRPSLGRFITNLRRTGTRAGASNHIVSEALYLWDPDGLGIEVYADRPRSTWRAESGQLVMDSLPLDLDDLVEASNSEPWTGMPQGTRLGHVHLHVGDIPAAERFYHVGMGLDKIVWSYPGALFLSAGGYHHHLGVNTWAGAAPPAGAGEARLLLWDVILPTAEDVGRVLASLEAAGYAVERGTESGLARDPWGTTVRFIPEGSA